MNIKLLVFVRLVSPKESYESKTGALVRLFDSNEKDPHLDFILDFEEQVIWNGELVPGKVYELVESNGAYALLEPMRTMTHREKNWCEKFASHPKNASAKINMCTLIKNTDTRRQEILFSTETLTRISVYELHNRLGPIPKTGGVYAAIRTFDACGTGYIRIVEPCTLKKTPQRIPISQEEAMQTY